MALGGEALSKSRRSRPEEESRGHVTAEDPMTARSAASPENGPSEDIRALKDELAALRCEQAKLQQAIFEAAQVQRRLCAPRELSWGEFEIAGEIFPVRHLSGDFFKVLDLGGALGLAVGDIAGKGLSAGIWLPHLTGLVQRCARAHPDPATALADVNRELCDGEGEPPMTALFLARMDPLKGKIVYCNAGLPSPLLLRRDKSVVPLEKGGPMLGALRGAAFNAGSVTLEPGDTLIAYSDGVTECRNTRDEEFDTKRLSAAAETASGTSASQALFSTLGAVLDFADGCSPGDDLTLLVVRRRDGALAARARASDRDSSTLRDGQARGSQPGGAGHQRFVS
jgi:serine phosphatase RsbU (regulator of sigma subunit)